MRAAAHASGYHRRMTQGTSNETTVLDVLANLADYPADQYPLVRYVASDAPKSFTSNGSVWIAEGGSAPPVVTPTLAQVLAAGNTSGARSILLALAERLDTDAAGQLLLGATTAATPTAAHATSAAMGSATGAPVADFQLFINQGGLPDNNSGAGIQYASTVASRAQLRVTQYGANTGVPGISSFKSRGLTQGALAPVVAGDVLFRATAVGVTPTNLVPLSGMISITVPPGGAPPAQAWIATEFAVQLVPLEGPVNGRKEMFKVTSQGVLATRSGNNRASGLATLDGAGQFVIPNTAVQPSTRFTLTVQDGTGVVPTGLIYQASRVNGMSFQIKSTGGAADSGVVVFWQLWEPLA